MFSISQLLDSAKENAKIESDYRLSKVIGKSHQLISGYRMGKSLPDESVIGQLCALSGDDPDVIAAQIQAARSKSPEAKNLWLRVAARMAGGASTAILSVLIAIVFVAGFAPPAWAKNDSDRFQPVTKSLYIVLSTILSVPAASLDRLRWCIPFFMRLCL